MVKFYVTNNYIRIVDINDSNKIYEAAKRHVLVTQPVENQDSYTVFINEQALSFASGLPHSDFQKEDGTPYASQTEFEDFYTSNTR